MSEINLNFLFLYFMNSVYRKLPFELGPLPALQSDCCILSKIAALKGTKQPKGRRGRGGRCKREPSTAEDDDSVADKHQSENDKQWQKLADNCRQLQSMSESCATMSTGGDKPCRIMPQSLYRVIRNNQPRKSPREHASTLAILSSLVQQKRKRLRELNGGISPEKMPNYNSSSADNDEPDEDDAILMRVSAASNAKDATPTTRSDCEDSQVLKTVDRVSTAAAPCDNVFRLRKGKRRQTLSTSSQNDVGEHATATPAAAIDSGKESEHSKDIKSPKMPVDDYTDPNKIVKQIDDLLTSCFTDAEPEIDDICVSADADDLILVNTPKDFVEIVNSVKEGPLTYRSFVNVNKRTGLSSFIQRGKKRHINKTGWPSMPKKRLAIKKEKLDGSCAEDDTNMANSNTEDDDNLSTIGAMLSGIDGDRIDISSQLKGDEFFIQARRGMKTPTKPSVPAIKEENYDDTEQEENDIDDGADGGDEDDDDYEESPFTDNAVNNLFASSSEKAENSDIFTVSSDSLDTADLVPEKETNCESKSNARTSHTLDDDESANESANESDDESSSDAPTIAEIVRHKKSTIRTAASALNCTTSKMETRAKGERLPISKGKLSHLRLQPIVCVKKMCEKDLYRRTYGKSLSPQKTIAPTSPRKSPAKTYNDISSSSSPPPSSTKHQPASFLDAYTNTSISTSTRTSTSPKTKISPRKLRKPRGKFYRETRM